MKLEILTATVLFLISAVISCVADNIAVPENLWFRGKPTAGGTRKKLSVGFYEAGIDSYGTINYIKTEKGYAVGACRNGNVTHGIHLRAVYQEGNKKENLQQCAWGSIRAPMVFYRKQNENTMIIQAAGGVLGAGKICSKPLPEVVRYSEKMLFHPDGTIKITYNVELLQKNVQDVYILLLIPLLPDSKLTLVEPDEQITVKIPRTYNSWYLLPRKYREIEWTLPSLKITASEKTFIRIQDPRSWAKTPQGISGKNLYYVKIYPVNTTGKIVLDFTIRMDVPQEKTSLQKKQK